MRKVLVFGAAMAATCVSAVAVSAATQTSAGVVHTGGHSAPSSAPTIAPVPTGDTSTSPTATSSPRPAPRRTAQESESVSSAQGVMVTPSVPRSDTYAYGHDRRQRLDAYWRPQRAKKGQRARPRPGILLLHGGYWIEGDKSGWRYTAWRLSSRGYAVFAANYRLAGAARWPAQRNDASAALQFIKRNAQRWNLDPQRIVVIGSSAGGHLATMLGTQGTGSEQVKGVVAMSPPTSPYLAYVDGGKAGASDTRVKLRESVRQLVGCTPREIDPICWARLDDANAANHASKGDAPMLLIHGASDFVPVTHSTALAGALRAHNVPVQVVVSPGTYHGLNVLLNERTYQKMLTWVDSVARS